MKNPKHLGVFILLLAATMCMAAAMSAAPALAAHIHHAIHGVTAMLHGSKNVGFAMLSIPLTGFLKDCNPNQGGISRIWVADPADFNFTQAGATDPYTAVALNSGATVAGGSGFFKVDFTYLEATYKAAQSVKGTQNKVSHTLTAQLPKISDGLNAFLFQAMEAAYCSALLVVMQFNTGVIKVMGEAWVNAAPIPAVFRIVMDGTEEDSGKNYDDFSGANVSFKGDYWRPAFTFTGGLAAITALEATGF